MVTCYSEKQKREAWTCYKAQSKLRPIIFTDISQDLPLTDPGALKKIVMRSALTQTTRDLLSKARNLAYSKERHNPFTHAWEQEGRVLVKVNENTKPIHIKNATQLYQLASAHDMS